MNRAMLSSAALAALTLTAIGCHKDSPAVSPLAHKATPTGSASAEQVAIEMRGDVKCPARASVERAAGAPIDDVVGVRPGMSLDEAANFVLCDDPHLVVKENTSRGYNINTYGQHIRQGFDASFAQARVVKTSAQIMNDMEEDAIRRGSNTYVAPLQPGQTRYYVSSMGLPGQERVLSVAREEYYAQGKLPTVDSVKQSLIQKYGEPSGVNPGQYTTYVWWEYDPSGAKITPTSPLSGACRINVSPDSGASLSTQCGVTVGAIIQGDRENPGLAHSLAVNSQNGAWGFSVLQNTEDALHKNDALRKTRELNDAAKNSNKPKV
jgi:hypothetical protein